MKIPGTATRDHCKNYLKEELGWMLGYLFSAIECLITLELIDRELSTCSAVCSFKLSLDLEPENVNVYRLCEC